MVAIRPSCLPGTVPVYVCCPCRVINGALFHPHVGVCMCVCCAQLLSCVRLSTTPWIVPHQAPLSMEFSRQEYGSRLPFLLQGIFLTQGSNLHLLHWQEDSLPLGHVGSQFILIKHPNLKSK